MDYARIYREFISDRLAKQPEAPVYFERHHIVPRALGGSNCASNLIRLTAEDHLFAHLLLARIHGGAMWSAVLLMNGLRGGRFIPSRQLRSAYGLARRAFGETQRGKDGLKGSSNGNYNHTIYKWRHLDSGEKRSSTLHDMWAEFGGTRGTWTSAVTEGSGKPSSSGWALDNGRRMTRSGKGLPFEFVNRDGRVFTGTQIEFAQMASLGATSASNVVRKQSVTICGWRLATTSDRHHATRKATGKYGNRDTGKIYQVWKTGKSFCGTVAVVAKRMGCTRQQFHAAVCNIKNGRSAGYKGWHIQWQDRLF